MLTDIFQPEWYHEKFNLNNIHPTSTDGVEVARVHKILTNRVISRFLHDPWEAMNNGIDIYLEHDSGQPYDPAGSDNILSRLNSLPVPLTEQEIWTWIKEKRTISFYIPKINILNSREKQKTIDMYNNLSGLDVSARVFASNAKMTTLTFSGNVPIDNHRAIAEIKSAIDYMKYVRQTIINKHTKKWMLATFISSSKIWLIDPSDSEQKFDLSTLRCLQNNYTSLDILNALAVYAKPVINIALTKIMRPRDQINKEVFDIDLISGQSTTISNMLDMIDRAPSMESTLKRNNNNPHYSPTHRM